MRTKLYSLVALLTSALPLTASAQGLADTRPVKPVLMLLVDTSGSMEHMPDSTGCTDCDPVCSSPTFQKNRWAITLEALTGTFNNFTCTKKLRSTYTAQYDATYFLPHYDFTTSATQASDGVLDSYANRLKFGLMTFDGVSTTSNGATLVPFANYASSATFRDDVLGVAGQYSYPPVVSGLVPAADAASVQSPINGFGWKPLSFPGCTAVYGINAGARGKGSLPGSLVSVGPTEVGTAIAATNKAIQDSLLAVRPFGGTPIAGMLDDLRYYLNNDTDIKRGSDPYYTCRKRYAILLTDGAPDTLYRNDPRFQCESTNDAACAGGACQCPYDSEETIALKLRQNDGLEKLWVVAFNVTDAVALATLDRIAQAGGQTDALRALTPGALRVELDKLMNIAQPEATSRSVPVVMNTGRAVMLGGKQFEITSGFKVGATDDEPWQGFLYRRRIECNGAAAEPQPLSYDKGDLFHLTLNARAKGGPARTLRTTLPGLTKVSGSLFANTSASAAISATKVNELKPNGQTFGPYSNPSLTATEAAQNETEYNNPLKDFDTSAATDPAYFSGGDATNRDNINKYLRGTSANRVDKALGDIYHSNPTVLPPLFTGSDDLVAYNPQLRNYYKTVLNSLASAPGGHYGAAGRPGVVFVGTNDGLLHAFNLDTWTNKAGTVFGPGYEFWSFVPSALFSKLTATAAPTHQFMFDGTPVIKEMVVNGTSGGTTIKTILLAAVRGAPAYVAFDITWPEEPTFLWQRSFPYLGDTVATPALAQVKVKWNSVDTVRGVAILPGGSGSLTTSPATSCDVDPLTRGKAPGGRDKVRCWGLKGRTLDVIDVLTGELIQEFDQRHFHSPLSGSVTVDGEMLSLTHAAYMTDEDGILWRLSMLSVDPSKWRVAPLWDLYANKAHNFSGTEVDAATTATAFAAGRVAMYPPLLTRNPTTGNNIIVVGTGDVDNLTDSAANRVVSLEEVRTIDIHGELQPGGVTPNWKLQLDAGEAVTGPLVMLDETVYFTSFRGPAGGTGDVCELGVSRIVGAHVRLPESPTSGLPKPGLAPETTGAMVLQYQPSTASSSLLLGLSIARDPVCTVGKPDNDPLGLLGLAGSRVTQTGATGGGAFQVRSMVAGSGGTVIPGSTAAGSGQRQFNRTLPVTNVARQVGWASSIE